MSEPPEHVVTAVQRFNKVYPNWHVLSDKGNRFVCFVDVQCKFENQGLQTGSVQKRVAGQECS